MRITPRTAAGLVAVLCLGLVVAVPGAATAEEPAVLNATKTASTATAVPGEELTFTIQTGCTTNAPGCTNATVTDVVPDAFEVVSAEVVGSPGTATVDGQTVTAAYTTPLSDPPGTQGLPSGQTGTVVVVVRVRDDLPYEASGVPVTNTATYAATNPATTPVQPTATVTPEVDLDLDATATKVVQPEGALAVPGTALTAALGATNASNAGTDSLTITDPADPTAAPSPFDLLEVTGFGTVTFPPAADRVQVEVWDGTQWVAGTPGPTAELPAGVPPEDVRGVRLTFTSSTGAPVEAGATAGVEVQLAQRDEVADLDAATTVTNTATGGVALDGEAATSDPASDTYVLTPVDVTAAAGKAFSPDAVTAGDPATVTLTGTNAGTDVDSMTLTEPAPGSPNPFEAGLTFTGPGTDGAGAGVVWPPDATALSVTYTEAGGGTETLTSTEPGTFPAPTGEVTGFTATFTGPIQPGATATVPFTVATDPDQGVEELTRSNQVQVEVADGDVTSDPALADDDLVSYAERLAVTTGKLISPGTIPAAAGQPVVVQIPAQLAPFPASTTDATSIVVQDPQVVPPDPSPDPWWDAFDATAITQTAVPAGATLSVSYWSESQQAWVPLPGAQDLAGPAVVNIPVPAELQDDIGGLQFDYEDPAGFPPGTSVQPNFTAALRPDSRSDGTPLPNAAQTIEDCASSTAGTDDLTAPPASGCATLDLTPTTPGGGDLVDKQLLETAPGAGPTVTARSAGEITALITWSTGGYAGLDQVAIADVAAPGSTPVAGSFFDAFDAVSVAPITPADDPWLTYDQVTAVEYWDGTQWLGAAADPCPAACDGTFPGLALTAGEQATATAVRLLVAESPTRADRIGGDPTAPQVGTGVARSSGDDRAVHLTFRLRDTRRSDGQPALGVTSGTVYNAGEAGLVEDTVEAVGTTDGTEVVRDTGADTATIIDVPLNVDLTKTWTGGPLGIPPAGTDPDAYPSGRVTVTAVNATAANVDRLAITDPAEPGAAGDPSDVVDVLDLVEIGVPAGATTSVVTLTRADGSATAYSPDDALALGAADLADVTAIAVEHTGRVQAGATATLVLDTRLRATHRSDATPVTLADSPVTDRARAQVQDLGGDVPGADPTADASAAIDLAASDISVVAGKSFDPAVLVEPDDGPVTMTLSGQPGGSARTVQMTLTDDDASFWNQYDLVALGDVVLAAPIDRVQVDALVGGTFTAVGGGLLVSGADWVEGAPAAAAALPGGVDAADVHGLRFTFTRADGAIWEDPADPLQVVPVTVQRRADLRSGGPVLSDLAGNAPAPGEDGAGVATDTVVADVTGAVLVGGEPVTATDDADATVLYQHATSAVDVVKTANGASSGTQVAPGVAFPYTLAFTNSGDVPITDPVVVDRLPVDDTGAQLVFPDAYPGGAGAFGYELAGDPPAEPNGPAMPEDPADVAVAVAGDVTGLTFTFPPGTVLEVGQAYTVTVQLMLRPGLPGGTTVANTVGVTGDRPWDACSPALDPGTGECQASASVVALSAGALRNEKLVRADGPDLGVVAADGTTCTPDADGFYATGCVPRSAPGSLVTWRVRVTNTGNLPMDRLRVGDELPRPGDTGIGNPQPRDSQWQPLLEGTPTVVESETGFSGVLSYTFDEQPCIDPDGCPPGAWTAFTGAEPQDLLDGVTGLLLDGTFATGQALDPLESISFEVTTRTPAFSPAAGPDTVAYNSVGSTARTVDGADQVWLLPTEGRKVGVALATGQVGVRKQVVGPAADAAPDTFALTLVCTSAVGTRLEATVPLGAAGDLVLAAGESVTVADLPWGAACTVTEDTAASGATEFTASTVIAVQDGQPVPVVLAVNRYDAGGLVIRKQVDSAAVDADGQPVAYGPFTVTESCTFLGAPVWADGYGLLRPMTQQLVDDQAVTLTGLPVGATCTITETDPRGGDASVVVTQSGTATPVAGPTADVVVVPDAAGIPQTEVVLTNAFGVGPLVLEKVVEGDGAAAYGSGPFTLAVSCTLTDASGTREVWRGDVVLGGGAPLTAGVADIAEGAVCEVVETDAAGATSSVVSGSPATIGDGTPVTVTATNTFDLGALEVVKVVDGDGADRYGAGPFAVRLDCTLDGSPVVVPGGATRSVAPGEPARYDGLPVGAACTATETGTGGATSTTVTAEGAAGGGAVVVPASDVAEVTVTNTFDVGEVRVVKRLDGPDAGAAADDVFTFALTCTRDVDGVTEPVAVPGGPDRDVSAATGWVGAWTDLPVGAACQVRETTPGAADVVQLVVEGDATTTPVGPGVEPASVTFVLPAGGDVCVPVEAINTFGAGAVPAAAGGGPGRVGAAVRGAPAGLAAPSDPAVVAAMTGCTSGSAVLSRTGADPTGPLVLALTLLLGGAGALLARRTSRAASRR